MPAQIRPIYDDQGSTSYTLAGDVLPGDSIVFDVPHAEL